jgi:hypothetical protein
MWGKLETPEKITRMRMGIVNRFDFISVSSVIKLRDVHVRELCFARRSVALLLVYPHFQVN